MKKTAYLLSICLLLMSMHIPASASLNNPDTDFFSQCKFGIMLHYLPQETADKNNLTSDEWNRRVNSFDVVAFADEIEEIGADYVMFTIGQNSGYYASPNATYESYAGYSPNTVCSTRDLPKEIAQELHKRDIRMIMYLPSNAPAKDKHAANNFGLYQKSGFDWLVNDAFKSKWADVIRVWSDQYGDLVDAWWFDGFYSWSGFNASFAQAYSDAAKSGNPHAIVTFNPGFGIKKNPVAGDNEDYIAGEIGQFDTPISTRWVSGLQGHVFSYLGHYWGSYANKYADDDLANYIYASNKNSVPVTIDMLIAQDSNKKNIYDGSFYPEHVNQMKRVSKLLDILNQPKQQTLWTFDVDTTSSNPSFTGTLEGNASLTTDSKHGAKALLLDGSTGYMHSDLVLSNTDDVALSAWVKPHVNTGNQIIVYNGDTSRSGYGIMIFQDKLTLLIGGKQIIKSTQGLPINEWHHVLISRNAGQWSLYLDGQKLNISSSTTPSVPTVGSFVGANNRGTENFNGIIDHVIFHPEALTDAEIAELSK